MLQNVKKFLLGRRPHVTRNGRIAPDRAEGNETRYLPAASVQGGQVVTGTTRGLQEDLQ